MLQQKRCGGGGCGGGSVHSLACDWSFPFPYNEEEDLRQLHDEKQQQQHILSSSSRRFLMIQLRKPRAMLKSIKDDTRFLRCQSRILGYCRDSMPLASSSSLSSSIFRFFSTDNSNHQNNSNNTHNNRHQLDDDKSNDNNHSQHQGGNDVVVVFYKAPLAELISRLKLISITTCFMSITVLPALIAIKNYDVAVMVVGTTATTTTLSQQISMGLFAFLGASGSTLALDYVFGPYVLEMAWIYPPDPNDHDSIQHLHNRHYNNNNNKDTDTTMDESTSNTDIASVIPTTTRLLRVTTRSIFVWKNTYFVNPFANGIIVPYTGGIRPFANFELLVNNNNSTTGSRGHIPLYVHSELLDDSTRQLLLSSSSSSSMLSTNHEETDDDTTITTTATTITSLSNPPSPPLRNNYTDREGLPKSDTNNNNEKKKKIRNKVDDEDVWW
jgi:hypothetical protein